MQHLEAVTCGVTSSCSSGDTYVQDPLTSKRRYSVGVLLQLVQDRPCGRFQWRAVADRESALASQQPENQSEIDPSASGPGADVAAILFPLVAICPGIRAYARLGVVGLACQRPLTAVAGQRPGMEFRRKWRRLGCAPGGCCRGPSVDPLEWVCGDPGGLRRVSAWRPEPVGVRTDNRVITVTPWCPS